METMDNVASTNMADSVSAFDYEIRACRARRLQVGQLVRRCQHLACEFLRKVECRAASSVDVQPALLGHLGNQLNALLLGLGNSTGPQMTCRELPEFCRLVALICSNWVTEMNDLFRRLGADSERIAKHFGHGTPLRLVNIIPGLSDPHNGGRTVHVLTFKGFAVVYKPRSIEIESRFQQFVKWFGHCLDHELCVIDMLEGDGYSWCEFVDCQPFENANESTKFFMRAGILLCVCYLLGMTDCHRNNISTTRRGPAVLDAETLFHPDFVPDLIPWRQPADTVLRTGFVESLHRLTCDSSSRASIIEGFAKGYSALILNSQFRNAVRARIDGFAGCRSRVVFRATTFYYETLRRSLSPMALRSRVERILALHALTVPFTRVGGPGLLAPLVESERMSLENLDIPCFFAGTTATEVTNGHSLIATSVIERAGLSAAQDRINLLSRDNLERMKELLHSVLTK